jgi:hypothetical protein
MFFFVSSFPSFFSYFSSSFFHSYFLLIIIICFQYFIFCFFLHSIYLVFISSFFAFLLYSFFSCLYCFISFLFSASTSILVRVHNGDEAGLSMYLCFWIPLLSSGYQEAFFVPCSSPNFIVSRPRFLSSSSMFLSC